LQKAAIEQVPTSSLGPGFYSRFFLVPKKKGGMRPVIDLSILNTTKRRYFLKATEIRQWK
jgi:hypothetical protein